MSEAKDFYKTYHADDNLSALSYKLFELIEAEKPVHAFEMGAGTGKNLRHLRDKKIYAFGIDVSQLNVIHAALMHSSVMLGDENYLRNICNADVVFTVSVLDHIQKIDGIIDELKRIANKCVFLAETNDTWAGPYYYHHDYEKYGFEKVNVKVTDFQIEGERLIQVEDVSFPFKWTSEEGDGADYYIWVWRKPENNVS